MHRALTVYHDMDPDPGIKENLPVKTPMQYLDRDPNAHRTDRVPGFQKDIGRNPVQTFDADTPANDEPEAPHKPASEPEAPAPGGDSPEAPTPAPAPNQPPVATPPTGAPGGLG